MTDDDLDDDDALGRWIGRAARLHDAPAAWVARAVAIGDPGPRAAAAATLRALLRAGAATVRAALAFDSARASPAAAGLRGDDGTQRQLVFTAAGHDIDLRIQPDGERFRLWGQVLGPAAATEVLLLPPEGDAGARDGVLDEFGGFELDGLDAGVYRLALRLGDSVVELAPLELGAAA